MRVVDEFGQIYEISADLLASSREGKPASEGGSKRIEIHVHVHIHDPDSERHARYEVAFGTSSLAPFGTSSVAAFGTSSLAPFGTSSVAAFGRNSQDSLANAGRQ